MIAINILALMESRVDRLLLVLGLILSLSSGFLLMRPQAVDFSTQSPVIGTLKTSSEVSRRHARSFSWGKIEKESNLFLKDMVYVPPQSSAEVILNSNEKLSLEPDSMVEFDSISSDRFNIVLMQGNAKLTSSNGTTTAVMTQNTEMEVRIPEAEKPQLPMFFIDTKAWELDQSGLIQKMDEQRKTTKLLTESEIKASDLSLNSILDYNLELAEPKITDSSSADGPWYTFSWTALPVEGTTYEIEVSRNKDFKPAIKHETRQVSLEVQFLEGESHFWKVIAKNNSERNPSASGSFTVPPLSESQQKGEGE